MKTVEINESSNPECFYLEDPLNPGSYTVDSIDATSEIDGCLKAIKKKAFDGVMYLALFADRIEIHWSRDIDDSPIRVAYFALTGQIYFGGQWYSQSFDFDYQNNPDEVDLSVVNTDKRYRVVWEKYAFNVTNYFGVDFTWTRRSVDFMFFLFSPENLVKLNADFYVRKAALKENRADGRGVSAPKEIGGIEPVLTENTPNENWNKYSYTHERETACETAGGRTWLQLFQQDAGLSVR